MMGAETGDAQGERNHNLQKKLFVARETTYRHMKQKYKATMKIFHEMMNEMSQLSKLLDMVQWQMDLDYVDITKYVLMVYTDCYWSRDILLNAQNVFSKQILDPLEEFKQQMYSYIVNIFPDMDAMTDGLIYEIDHARAEHMLGTDPLIIDFGACMEGRFTTKSSAWIYHWKLGSVTAIHSVNHYNDQ
jgi:hypothetical protein